MPKVMTILGMVVAAFTILFFALDIFGFWFKHAHTEGKVGIFVNVLFILSGIILGYMSWSAYRET